MVFCRVMMELGVVGLIILMGVGVVCVMELVVV